MKKLTVVLIGAGNRGRTYTKYMKQSEKFEIVGVAEPLEDRRELVRELHNIPEENCFDTWETLLARPKFADIAIIATSDALHYAPAMKAIELGYNLLLEKPAAPTPEQCADIANAAKAKGVKILVCHVLRYTLYWSKMKEMIEQGCIGEVMSVHHAECVGNIHQSHSYVRGNWGNTAESSNMLLAKSCHDIDLIQWLVGSKCTYAQSFGSLSHFRRENAPEGAPEYCHEGCPHEAECYYAASKIYSINARGWYRGHAIQKPNPTEEQLEEMMRTTQYGKCVYKCNNDVVDHQVVNMEFESGAVASFNMSGFNKGGRHIRIMGTDGELYGCHGDNRIYYYSFKTKETQEINPMSENVGESIASGHGGGDGGIVEALYNYIAEGIVDSKLSEIGISVENHLIVFAAEQARLNKTVVDVQAYTAKYLK